MAADTGGKLYRITGVTDEMQRGEDGAYHPAKRVAFVTALGQHSHVIVPRSDTLEDDAHAAVERHARQLIDLQTRPTVPPYQG